MTEKRLRTLIKIDMKVDERRRNPEIKRSKDMAACFGPGISSHRAPPPNSLISSGPGLRDATDDEQLRPAVPTLPCIDEGPHRTWYDKVQA